MSILNNMIERKESFKTGQATEEEILKWILEDAIFSNERYLAKKTAERIEKELNSISNTF